MFAEYPKSLYLDGDIEREHVIVHSADDEQAKRAEGFRVAWEPEEKGEEPAAVPKRRGRPPKHVA